MLSFRLDIRCDSMYIGTKFIPNSWSQHKESLHFLYIAQKQTLNFQKNVFPIDFPVLYKKWRRRIITFYGIDLFISESWGSIITSNLGLKCSRIALPLKICLSEWKFMLHLNVFNWSEFLLKFPMIAFETQD